MCFREKEGVIFDPAVRTPREEQAHLRLSCSRRNHTCPRERFEYILREKKIAFGMGEEAGQDARMQERELLADGIEQLHSTARIQTALLQERRTQEREREDFGIALCFESITQNMNPLVSRRRLHEGGRESGLDRLITGDPSYFLHDIVFALNVLQAPKRRRDALLAHCETKVGENLVDALFGNGQPQHARSA